MYRPCYDQRISQFLTFKNCHHNNKTKNSISKNMQGKRNSLGYKHSKTTRLKHRNKWKNKEYRQHMIDVHKLIKDSKETKMKKSISIKKKWSEPLHRQTHIQAILIGNKNSPNKQEQKLLYILQSFKTHNFKFVGNGKVVIYRFCPDYIDIKKNMIIELFGDYWHNKPDSKKKDKLKLKTYKKYNYKVLVIWEKELKNISILKSKIIKFLKGGN
jgi:hypothetical protein